MTDELNFDGPKSLHPSQTELIAKARDLRSIAIKLREQVSQGSYGDTELHTFYGLVGSAPFALHVSNPQLAERAGLGDSFFSTVARSGRRPKLANFLRALTAIIEIANDRLYQVDNQNLPSSSFEIGKIRARLEDDHEALRDIAATLGELARQEIERLDSQIPNDPDSKVRYERQRELLFIFADGFERIARSLSQIESKETRNVSIATAAGLVGGVSKQLSEWWLQNGADATDWIIRIPIFVSGVAALGWAGANMTVATTAVAAMVGGKKVMEAIKTPRKSK